MYGYFRTYSTYFTFLAGVCFAIFSVSSVAQELPPSQRVSVDWSPTTSHWQTNNSTFRTPPGVTTSTSTAVGPVTRLASGGASQPLASGITITSLERSAPVASRLMAGVGAVRNAVTRCFINVPCNIAVAGLTLGLEDLFERTDWFLTDDDEVVTRSIDTSHRSPFTWNGNITEYDLTLFTSGTTYNSSVVGFNYLNAISQTLANNPGYILVHNGGRGNSYDVLLCAPSFDGFPLTGYTGSSNGLCLYGSGSFTPLPDVIVSTPVSPSAIESGVNDYYNFDPSDWPSISRGLDIERADVEIEITSLPTLIVPPRTTTVYDANGVPYAISETNIEIQLEPTPGTNPGPQPGIDLKETETTTTTNADGTVTGSTTTTSTRPAGNTDLGTGGGGAPQTPWPGFCEWASTVCSWLDWTQEGWPDEDPDLPTIIDFEPDGNDFQVGGAGACPAPYVINLSMFDSTVAASFQPFCDLADLMKPLFLAFCYFFAGVLTVRSL